jgi:hypothetical protein
VTSVSDAERRGIALPRGAWERAGVNVVRATVGNNENAALRVDGK